MEPIGFIESCYKDKFGTPRQPGLVAESWAKLTLRPDLHPQDSLQGLEGFSHVWLIWQFHQNTNQRFHAKVHPPRAGGKTFGVFATRSPHRPNPIGLSLVKLEKIENSVLFFSGIDLVDGTPILDIKPYLPEVESIPEATTGWTQEASNSAIQVTFTPESENQLKKWKKNHPEIDLRAIIINTIKLDPRPLVYRGHEGNKVSPYREIHAFRIFDSDVHFRFINPGEAQVLTVLKLVP